HLLLFSKRRNELYNLYFGVFSLFLPVYIFTRSNIVFEFPVDSILIQRVELIVLYPLPMLITVFAEQLFFGKVSKFTWKMLFLSMALALPNLFVPGFIMEYILRVWQVMTLFTITYSFTVTVKAVRMRLPNSRRLFWGMTALILTAVFDILDSLILNTGLAFTKFAFLIFVIGVAGMLSNRFLELYEEVEDHRNNLEKKVTERTKELQSTLQQVQILKEQQDGIIF
ncbi:MAG TPA: 7TM diverse intracellular signaling domain-containing protein, partial [Leptospiraceae bacterium]|nr:7TM diverse intracellular signaling domain-containing protein [Leptospiraceae bacterium]